jgi:polar amino acid transport system substrate-binding protein
MLAEDTHVWINFLLDRMQLTILIKIISLIIHTVVTFKYFLYSSLVYLLFLLTALAQANDTLLFVVSHPGSAPYLYFDKDSNEYQGVIPDVFNKLIKSEQIKIRYISNSRKRSEEYIYQGQADLMMLSKSWLNHPEKIIATISLHEHRSFLYKTAPFATDFSLDSTIQSEPLCTREGFIYPNLKTAFETRRIFRVDSSNHLSMMSMLFKERCTYVIMNEYNALNLMKTELFKGKQLYRSKEPISIVPLNIILRPSLTQTKKILDEHIQSLKKNGELTNIIERHTLSEP